MEITTQYMEFLQANYPDIAGRLDTLMSESPTGNTPEEIEKAKAKIDEEIKTLANDSERVHKYEIWEKVPTILRDRYNGRVPPEIMEAAARDEIYVLREMEYHPEKKNVDEVRAEVEDKYGNVIMPEDIAASAFVIQSVFAAAVVAGYSPESCAALARHRMEGDSLIQERDAILKDPNLSDEERKQKHREWLENSWFPHQEKKRDIIVEDWGGGNGKKPHQPEKMLLHVLGRYNAGVRKFEAGKINEEELGNLKEKMVAMMADLQPHLAGRQNELLSYLQRDQIQAKIGQFKDETRDLLAHYVLNELPDSERSKIMEQALRRSQKSKEGLSEDQQAMAVAKNMSATKANKLPQETNLSASERMANMPSSLSRGGNERQI